MLYFLLGCWVGAIFSFIILAILIMSREEDDDGT